MADIQFEAPSGVIRKYQDMGDGTHAEVVAVAGAAAPGGESAVSPSGVTASDGVFLPVDSLAQTLSYTSGQLSSIAVVFSGSTYVQTLGYTAGVLTSVSKWVKQ